MANDINRVVLIGRLTRPPELRALSTGSYLCRFTLASNRVIYQRDGENKEEVGFFDCVTFGKLAEAVSKYAQKGHRVSVDGSLRFSSWENNEGKKQSKVEINVEKFQFLEPRKSDNTPESSQDGHTGQQTNDTGTMIQNEFGGDFDDSIPF